MNKPCARRHSDTTGSGLGLLIEAMTLYPEEPALTQFYSLIAACALFSMMALPMLNQAAQIVA